MDERKKKALISVVIIMMAAVPLIICKSMRDTIIINIGVRGYKAIDRACIVLIVFAVVLILLKILFFIKKLPKSESAQLEDIVDEGKMTESDRQGLYQKLKTFGEGKWSEATDVKSLYDQLDSMNEYQNNMEFLLEQTKYLTQQPVDIIQRVEDCMYLNIKKLLNYMQVLQKRDMMLLRSKVAECVAKNDELLQKAKDFVLAVIDYVNKDMQPGESERTVNTVNSYMYIVLDAIEKEDIYLS